MSDTVPEKRPAVERITWEEFRSLGLLWYVNRALHPLGFVIAYDQEGNDGWPARSCYSQFTEEVENKNREKFLQAIKCGDIFGPFSRENNIEDNSND